MDSLKAIAPRRLEALVPLLLADEPVVVLAGARTVGKSTLLRRLADPNGNPVLDLDDLTTRALVRDDLGFYAAGASPVLIDEFQHVPELLDAIKAELNTDPRPGRFLLTGSTRYTALPRAAQSLTGRVQVVTVWPLSQPASGADTATFDPNTSNAFGPSGRPSSASSSDALRPQVDPRRHRRRRARAARHRAR